MNDLNDALQSCIADADRILTRLAPELEQEHRDALGNSAAASIAVGLLTEHAIVATDVSTQSEPLVFADEEAAHTVRCILHLVHHILGAAGLVDQGDARSIRLVSVDTWAGCAFDAGYLLVETLDHGGPRDVTPDMGLTAAEIVALAAGVRL